MSEIQRHSQVVVNIPVVGDDNPPTLDKDLYQAEILDVASGVVGDTTFTANDKDVLIPNNCIFKLIPGKSWSTVEFYYIL